MSGNACEWLLDRHVSDGGGARPALRAHQWARALVRGAARPCRVDGCRAARARVADGRQSRARHARLTRVHGVVPRHASHRRDPGPRQPAAAVEGHRRRRGRREGRPRARLGRTAGGERRCGRAAARHRFGRVGGSGGREGRREPRADRRRLARLLALHVGQHGSPEARDAPPRRPPGHRRHLRPVGARRRRRRRLLLGRTDVPRVWARQLADVPDGGRRIDGARGEATADAAEDRRGRHPAAAVALLRDPRLLRGAERFIDPRRHVPLGATRRVRGRGVARGDVASVSRSLRRRDPRRHRLDRDDAHLLVEPRRSGATRHDRFGGHGVRGARRRRRRRRCAPTTSPGTSGSAATRRRRATSATRVRPSRRSGWEVAGSGPATPMCATRRARTPTWVVRTTCSGSAASGSRPRRSRRRSSSTRRSSRWRSSASSTTVASPVRLPTWSRSRACR